MRSTTLLILFAVFLAPNAFAYDWEYSYKNPNEVGADLYITETQNANVYNSGAFTFWSPVTPNQDAVINYQFSFPKAVESATLGASVYTFNHGYSAGVGQILGSIDGDSWIELADVTSPEEDGWNSNNRMGWDSSVPAQLLGSEELYLRVVLRAINPGASGYTWTAEHSRYDSSQDNTTFSLNVNYVPEPTALSCGLLAILSVLCTRRPYRLALPIAAPETLLRR